MYTVGRHAVSSGGVTVTIEPPRRCICVATGVVMPDDTGKFSAIEELSGIAESLLGDKSSTSPVNVELFAFAFVAEICARGFLFFFAGRGVLADGDDLELVLYISVGVAVILLGVRGNALSLMRSGGGQSARTLTLGSLLLSMKDSSGKKPCPSNMLIVSPFLRRFHGSWTSGVLFCLFDTISPSVALLGGVLGRLKSFNSSKSRSADLIDAAVLTRLLLPVCLSILAPFTPDRLKVARLPGGALT